jgi:hypothetical protein
MSPREWQIEIPDGFSRVMLEQVLMTLKMLLMIRLPSNTKVFLALGTTDMRKAVNNASEQMKKDIFPGNRNRIIVKILSLG